MTDWKKEVSNLSIADVAAKLGIQLSKDRSRLRRALCPFHDDRDPSLYLYDEPDPHYHCFVCQAHGDTVELVKQHRRVDFPTALEWLAENFGIDVEAPELRRRKTRQDILSKALQFWGKRSTAIELNNLASARHFQPDALSAAGVVVGSVEEFLSSIKEDREAQEEAIAAGLAYPLDSSGPAELRSSSLSAFARGKQVLIPLRNIRGKAIGVMARQIAGSGPKYRFTTGFKKSEVLYRADLVRRLLEAKETVAALDGRQDRFDLFVCEGVFDALRLESLNLPAVAALGASLSDSQIKQISELAELATDRERVLRVHLFFDADKGGRRGISDSLPRLLAAGAEADFLVDIVGLDRPSEDKADPDIILQGASVTAASEIVSPALYSAIDGLAAVLLDRPFEDIDSEIDELDAAGSIILQNRLARRLKGLDWPKIWRRLAPDRTTLATEAPRRSEAVAFALERMARENEASQSAARALPLPFEDSERSHDAALLHAMILARESTDSREYPVDVATWDRLEEASQLFLPLIEDSLRNPEAPRSPYLAHFEPKDSGAPRLKCGPCPEEAIQQQYVLSELLRVRPERTGFAEQIPAVRYWQDHPALVVTGVDRPASAVSFAYQVDMRALEERPDRNRRRDMFRPFIDCWNSFILHVGSRIDKMHCDLIYIARLDVKGFYDNVPRHAVRHVLERSLPESETLDVLEIAPLFAANQDDRRTKLINWILDHSFGSADRGYRYTNPSNGEDSFKGGAKGVPQGPSLSSYLANIVLFGLDSDIEERVRILDAEAAAGFNASTCGGIYARYVDDIIIAARTPEDLRALRIAIENKLEPLGLELNEKSEHLEPMTMEEAQNWVVERRGAGFLAYGEPEDQPSPPPDVRSSWADIPTLDRRTALSLLYWSALDDPEQTTREEFEEMLDTVARADGLRPTDLSHIAKRVGLRAALDAGELSSQAASAIDQEAIQKEVDQASEFLRQYLAMLRPITIAVGVPRLRVKPDDSVVSDALVAARFYLATLAGLERLIMGNAETNPGFSPEVKQRIAVSKVRVLTWILNQDLLSQLEAELIPAAAREGVANALGAQIAIAKATLEERAARSMWLRPEGRAFTIAPRPAEKAPGYPSALTIRIGWYRRFAPDRLAEEAHDDPFRLFHAISAQVQVQSGRLTSAAQSTALPPAAQVDAMRAAASVALAQLETDPRHGQAQRMAGAFQALAGDTTQLPAFLRMRALSAFMGLAAGPFQATALTTRPGLLGDLGVGGSIIPIPPIPDQPGIFHYTPARRVLRAVLVSGAAVTEDELPAGLHWQLDQQPGQLAAWSAQLPEGVDFLLDPETKKRKIPDDLDTIADVFEGLLESHGQSDGPHSALVHVFSLIGPLHRNLTGPYLSASWRLRQEVSAQLVFERRGDGIAVERAPHAGAQLWRIGQSVSDLFSIASDLIDDHAPVRQQRELLQDRLKRMAFSRLRGKWINAGQVTAALASQGVPKSLTRIVKALREVAGADDTVGPLALEFFLAGRAMRTRMRLGPLVTMPGGWARFIELVGARTLSSGDDDEIFSIADVQETLARHARALTRAGASIEAWSQHTDQDRCRNVLCATAVGFRLNALRQDLRDVVLAALARMTQEDRTRLLGVRPVLSAFGGRGSLVLIEPRLLGDELRTSQYDLDTQARDLFETLVKALDFRALPGRAALERISTAGWLTILATMSGAIDFEMVETPDALPQSRPAFFALADSGVATPLRQLAESLVDLEPRERTYDPEAWPWEIAETFDRASLSEQFDRARETLDVIREAIGIIADTNPTPLRMLKLGDREVEFITDNGDTFRLPWWRVSLLTTVNERLDRAETVTVGDRLIHPYSVLTEPTGRPLVVQLLSEACAAVVGLHSSPEALQPGQGIAGLPERDDPRPPDSPPSGPAKPTLGEETPTEPRGEQTSRPPKGTGGAVPPKRTGSGALQSLRERQQRSWRARGRDVGIEKSGYARVALLQYDFLPSYELEALPRFRLDGAEVQLPRVSAGAVDLQLSFQEHRRRRVLAGVVASCQTLGVEALLVPEYALAPETITWLEALCEEQGYEVSIWAGTFRQQPGFSLAIQGNSRFVPVEINDKLAEIRPMDAVLSALFRETQTAKALEVRPVGVVQDEAPIFSLKLPNRLAYRRKKYPSIGLNEDFRPNKDSLAPLMVRSRSLNRVESFISELVCSELFVFNGPLNWVNFADHLQASVGRYNIDQVDWMAEIVADSKTLATTFSGQASTKPRRSILFLTCATSRDADYHYFAQSAYLASGIVTAFCNSIAPGARGGSCFVGLGGWETEGGRVAPNPYHGAAPGILSVARPTRGVLGPKERALVVVDIRPERTVEDRPRSQTMGTPMRLAAHIPIIESHTCSRMSDRWDERWWRPTSGKWLDPERESEDVLDTELHDFLYEEADSVSLDTLATKLLQALDTVEHHKSTERLPSIDRRRLVSAAISLAATISTSPGMRQRAVAMAKGLLEHPEKLPCPSLLDWLVVDLDLEDFGSQLREAHALDSTVPHEVRQLSSKLQNAAWRWLAPVEDELTEQEPSLRD